MTTSATGVEALRRRVHSSTLVAVGDWNPDLHPRGHDGKFIETFGLINLIDMPGFRHGQRGDQNVQGEVSEIIPDPDDPGNPIIRVKMTDPRWDAKAFGEHYDAHSYQVSQREPAKAVIKKPVAKTVKKPVAKTELPSTPSEAPSIVPPTLDASVPLPPLVKPGEWDSLSPVGKNLWVKAQMETDLTAFRNKPTIFDMTGTDPEMGFALADKYRELTGIDTKTALRIDYVATNALILENKGGGFLSPENLDYDFEPTSAIAVAHPGTEHPGGIGPIVKPLGIVLNDKFFKDMTYWNSEKGGTKSMPWSVGSSQSDYTTTMVHEFGHHRQFRYFAETMLEVGQPWSKVTMNDGFGSMPDSSNWPEIQKARYDIQNMAPSMYGKSKSSEAFAEVWAAVTTGYIPLDQDLQNAWDIWHGGMEIPGQMPQDRFTPDELTSYETLTPEQIDEHWNSVGHLFELPGMREHYPESAAEFDARQGGAAYADTDFAPDSEPVDTHPPKEVGSLSVGDEVILPGDIPGTVTGFEFAEGSPDAITVHTDNGSYIGKLGDMLPSATPNGDGLEDRFVVQFDVDDDGDGGYIELREKDGGDLVATMKWRNHGVSHIGVVPKFRRQGIATALFRRAREVDPELKHGMVLSEDAKSWVEALPLNEQQQIGKD